MNLNDALQHATSLARMLFRGSEMLGHRSMNNAPLLATLSIMAAAKSDDLVASIDPRIKEIILFGSTARGVVEPGDIDLMVFDGGFYSNVLGFEPEEAKQPDAELAISTHFGISRRSSWGGWGEQIRENLQSLLEGWFECTTDEIAQFNDILVDLQVLPITLIADHVKRIEVGKKHIDPHFFEKAFSKILRFDTSKQKFVPTTIAELEAKYNKILASEKCETA